MKKYKIGDEITAIRDGSREVISGKIKEIFKDVIWGYYSAVVQTDKGERIITTEVDRIIS